MSYEEKRARTFLQKATLYRNEGKTEQAIKELLSQPGSPYDGAYRECIDMLVHMCLCTEDARYGTRLDLRNTLSRMKRSNQNLEEDTKHLMDMILRHFDTMTADMQRKMEAMAAAPSQEDQLVAALTGIPVAERARERYFLPCQRAAQKLAQGLFGRFGLGLSSKTYGSYIKYAIEFITRLHELGMKDAVVKTCYWVVEELLKLVVDPITGHNNAAQELRVNRQEFMKSDSSCKDTIVALCRMVTFLSQEGNWPNDGWNVLKGLKRIADTLMGHKGALELRGMAYDKIASVFWECRVTTFHAYCLAIAARQRSDNTPTRAVLAAILCPEVNERHNPFAPNYDSRAVHEDIAELFGEPDISRSELIASLKTDGSVAQADPLTRPLMEAFASEAADSSTDFASLHATLSALLAKDAALVQYEKPIRQALLRRQMDSLAATTTRVNMQELAEKTAKVTATQYLRDVEPAFLQDASLPIEIDSKTQSVIFRNATRATVLSAFTKLAAAVDLGKAQPAAPTLSTSAALSSITVHDLIAAHAHARAIHNIQHASQQAAHQRKVDLEKREEDERKAKVDSQRNAEAEKQERARQTKYKKLLAEYRERQRQERCKKVLEKLRVKYPRFKIDNAIASKSANAFEDELTAALAAFKRREVEDDSRDTLRGNLFERALRQLEIPRRKEMEAVNAEQHKAERAAARQNYLLQHRKEFDRRQEERVVLQKFLPDAEAFVEKWQRAAGGEKASKRDEQQQLLEQEKRRLAELS